MQHRVRPLCGSDQLHSAGKQRPAWRPREWATQLHLVTYTSVLASHHAVRLSASGTSATRGVCVAPLAGISAVAARCAHCQPHRAALSAHPPSSPSAPLTLLLPNTHRCAALGPPAPPPPPMPTMRFDSPKVHDASLAWCWGFGPEYDGSQCGDYVALRFCQLQRYTAVASVQGPVTAPGITRFQHYHPFIQCSATTCKTFDSITCIGSAPPPGHHGRRHRCHPGPAGQPAQISQSGCLTLPWSEATHLAQRRVQPSATAVRPAPPTPTAQAGELGTPSGVTVDL